MTSFTPIKVRGKRHGAEAGNWHAGKTRKTYREDSVTPSEGSFSAQSSSSSSSRKKSRRRREPELSRLEELPTEILQAIFVFSGNVDFPLVSPKLASQLSGAGRHLHHQLTSQVLRPLLARDDGLLRQEEPDDYAAVARFMNSKFFTWPFVKDWLEGEFKRRDLLYDWQQDMELYPHRFQPDGWPLWLWSRIGPTAEVMPPRKLLKGPFTEDKIRLLILLESNYLPTPGCAELSDLVTADALRDAVAEGATEVLRIFWNLGGVVDTEVLRYAVIDAGCEKEVVSELVRHSLEQFQRPGDPDPDILDPALWAWAEKAKERDDEKGKWLTNLLKDAGRKRREGIW